MNTLTKVFGGIILVLVVAFCFTAQTLYSKGADLEDKWKAEQTAHEHTREDLTRQIKDLKRKNARQTGRIAYLERDKRELFALVQDLKQQLKDKSNSASGSR